MVMMVYDVLEVTNIYVPGITNLTFINLWFFQWQSVAQTTQWWSSSTCVWWNV